TPPGSGCPSSRALPARRRARTGSTPRGRAPPQRARRGSPRTRARCGAAALARRSARSSREARGELCDQADAVPGSTGHPVVVAARSLEKAGPGHVDVRPGPVARELLEELCGEHRRPLSQVRAVLQIGECGVDVAPVTRMEGECPDEVAAPLARCDDAVPPGVVVREKARVEIAERELHRACERCEIDDVRGPFAPGVPERVGEYE